jgi:hypothetical protein
MAKRPVRNVLFVGGPLHNKVHEVETSAKRYAAIPLLQSITDLWANPPTRIPGNVVYNITGLRMPGYIIWIGHLGPAPDNHLVFDVLLSKEAKMASEPALWLNVM